MPQRIFICIDQSNEKWSCPVKIGHLYMNRFAIDEEAAFEIQDVITIPLSAPYGFIAKEMLRSAFQKLNNEKAALPIHLFYASNLFAGGIGRTRLRIERDELIKKVLIEFKIDSILLTTLGWFKFGVCSKEMVENWYTEPLVQVKFLHDELDMFFYAMYKNIADTSEFYPINPEKSSINGFSLYSFRKLKKKESKLVDQIDEVYMEECYLMYNQRGLSALKKYTGATFRSGSSLHNSKQEMVSDIKRLQLSESKSRYVIVSAFRDTVLLRDTTLNWTKEHQQYHGMKTKPFGTRSNKRNKKRNKTKRR